MTGHLTQSVVFKGGMYDGRMADITFQLPFSLDTIVSCPEGNYKVRRGPLAQLIEAVQEAKSHFVLVLVPA